MSAIYIEIISTICYNKTDIYDRNSPNIHFKQALRKIAKRQEDNTTMHTWHCYYLNILKQKSKHKQNLKYLQNVHTFQNT